MDAAGRQRKFVSNLQNDLAVAGSNLIKLDAKVARLEAALDAQRPAFELAIRQISAELDKRDLGLMTDGNGSYIIEEKE